MASQIDAADSTSLCALAVQTLYSNSSPARHEMDEAIRLFRRAAERGSIEAWGHLARISLRYDSGVAVPPASLEKAVAKWTQDAENGDPNAQFYLGQCYRTGTGVSRDFDKTVRFYRASADQGNLRARFNLAMCYEKGVGVEKDHALAFELFTDCAKKGSPKAQCFIGQAYDRGRVVRRDPHEAVRNYRLAAEQGNAQGQFWLGTHYRNGTVITQDLAEATRLFKLAADRDCASAQCALATCYLQGIGVEWCPVKAVDLFERNQDRECYRRLLSRALKQRARLGWTIGRHKFLRTAMARDRVAAVFLCHSQLSENWEASSFPVLVQELCVHACRIFRKANCLPSRLSYGWLCWAN